MGHVACSPPMRLAPMCVLLVACGGPSGALTLDGPGFRLDVTREPFSFAVTTDAGVRIDGRSLGFAEGTFNVVNAGVLAGQYSFPRNLDWHESWAVTATEAGADSLRVELAAGGGAPAVAVTFRVRPQTLRIEAEKLDGAPRAWAVTVASPADE